MSDLNDVSVLIEFLWMISKPDILHRGKLISFVIGGSIYYWSLVIPRFEKIEPSPKLFI
jgi:hypothetical protein